MPSQASPVSRWTRLLLPRHTMRHRHNNRNARNKVQLIQDGQLKRWELTSKSCKLRISSSGGRELNRSFRRLSSSEMETSTFWTVPISTAPRLLKNSGIRCEQAKNMMWNLRQREKANCFSGGRLSVIAFGGCIGSYSWL